MSTFPLPMGPDLWKDAWPLHPTWGSSPRSCGPHHRCRRGAVSSAYTHARGPPFALEAKVWTMPYILSGDRVSLEFPLK